MNRYYHTVELSFNSWMIIVLLAVVAMAIIGAMQYVLIRDKSKRYTIHKRYVNQVAYIVNAALTTVFTIVLVKDSWRGILQTIDNHLSGIDSPAWSVILFPLVVIAFAGVFAASCYLVGKIAGFAKIGILYERMQNSRKRL